MLCNEACINKKKAGTLANVSKYILHKNLAMTILYVKISTADIQKEMDEVGGPILDIIKSVT